MRFMKIVRFKPKPEFLDDFLNEYHLVTEKALKDGSIESYFTAIIEDEIIYVGTFNEIEKDTNTLTRGLGWLDQYRHMLQPYGEEGKYALVENGVISKENSITSR